MYRNKGPSSGFSLYNSKYLIRYVRINNPVWSECLLRLELEVIVIGFTMQWYIYVRISGHYTIIDFNEVDIRIYLPEKAASVNITFEGR